MTDTYLLAKMIQAEAEGEPYIGKIAVGAVIVNRLKSPDFPNSITDIIYQPGQFSPVADGRFAGINNIMEDCLSAAKLALSGVDPTGGALFFYNPEKVSKSSWVRSREIIYLIGDHVFCI